jgi:hypothetical protein
MKGRFHGKPDTHGSKNTGDAVFSSRCRSARYGSEWEKYNGNK